MMLACDNEIIYRNIIVYCEFTKINCQVNLAPVYLPGKMLNGRVAGLKNCKPFTASAAIHVGNGTNSFMQIEMETFELVNDSFLSKEKIQIFIPNQTPGNWMMDQDSIFWNVKNKYDVLSEKYVLEDRFSLNKSYECNYIAIEEFKTLTNEVQGTFQCMFLLDPVLRSGQQPDTVLFTECHFLAKVL